LDGSSAWDLLTQREREIITPKIKPDGGQTVYEAFNERFGKKDTVGHLDRQATEVNVIHVVNFIDRAGGRKNSPMWQQISELKTITYPHLVVTIPDHRKFIAAAEKEGFQEIKGSDQFIARVGLGYHKFNSIREITVFSSDFSMHFANDHGDNTYFVHWDPTSVTFIPELGWKMFGTGLYTYGAPTGDIAKGILYNAEWLYRGFFHGSFPKPADVRAQLIRYGRAPRER
jgi:hypothetical protein